MIVTVEDVRRDLELETVVLTTERLRIGEMDPSDLADLFEHWSNPTYLEHMPADPGTPARVGAAIERARLDRLQDPRRRYHLIARDIVSGAFVGEASIDNRSLPWREEAEIGYSIRQDQAGRGLGTELARAMRDFGFARLGIHRITAQCRVENDASRRVMAKLGMTEEGLLRQNVRARGDWWSSVQCSILATDWR